MEKESSSFAGEESSGCSEGDCEASSFDKGTERSKTSTDNVKMHAGSVSSTSKDEGTVCSDFAGFSQEIHVFRV